MKFLLAFACGETEENEVHIKPELKKAGGFDLQHPNGDSQKSHIYFHAAHSRHSIYVAG
jgi:hypothetical protein